MCLRFVQSVYGAPVKYASAWDAWNATTLKHLDRNLPPVSVPLWFSHYGTYGGVYANWGHVVAYFPEREQFLSSPPNGYGHTWLNNIEEIERMFNSKYVGWSEDLNGLDIVKYNPNGEKMAFKIIRPYDLDDRAVIGEGIGYAFPNRGEFEHFLNVWGMGTPDTVPTSTVGDASMSPEARRNLFKTIVKIHHA
jgi:hypothetical protein